MRNINKFEYSQAKAILYTRIILLICILAQALAGFELCKQNKQLKSKPPEKKSLNVIYHQYRIKNWVNIL